MLMALGQPLSEFINHGVLQWLAYGVAMESSRPSSRMRRWSALSLLAPKLVLSSPSRSCFIQVRKDLLALALGLWLAYGVA